MSGSFDPDPVARVLSSAINPALAVLIPIAPIWDRRWREAPGSSLRTGRWFTASVVGIAATVTLAELGKHWQIWSGHKEFPSGHETFAAAAAAALIVRDRRWALVVVPLVLLIGWALVCAGYHEMIEVAGGLALGSVVAGSIAGTLARG